MSEQAKQAVITIGDKDYAIEDLSPKVRGIIQRLQYIQVEMQRLSVQIDVISAADKELKALLNATLEEEFGEKVEAEAEAK